MKAFSILKGENLELGFRATSAAIQHAQIANVNCSSCSMAPIQPSIDTSSGRLKKWQTRSIFGKLGEIFGKLGVMFGKRGTDSGTVEGEAPPVETPTITVEKRTVGHLPPEV